VNEGETSLLEILERARDLGFLGPGPVEAHIAHARGFLAAETALRHPPRTLVDLGSGGGVPGLVLAAAWPESRVALVESGNRRVEHLRRAVDDLGWRDRVEILHERAETVARSPEYREQFEAVSARSFAAPAVTAEIAAGLVARAGVVVVSEPPEPDEARWPEGPLARLGFGPATPVEANFGHFVVLFKQAAAPQEAPRASGRPAKRPLW
jgi:16S rRNA (guanine527-N7)-methyltransferase